MARDLTEVKQQAIENLARAGVRMTLLQVLIRDVNENALPHLFELMRTNENILSLTIQTMTYTGQGGGRFHSFSTNSGRRGCQNGLPGIERHDWF